MVMINLNDAMRDIEEEYTNSTLGFGHVSDYDEVCTCDECMGAPDEDQYHAIMAEDLEDSVTEVIETLIFLGDGTSPRDVMKAILSLESQIALLKLYLLESEE